MQELEINPKSLDRTTDTCDLPLDVARNMQRINTTRSQGRLIRDYGCARTQATGNTTTVTSSFASSTQACNVIALTGDTAGSIKITPGSGCGGPKNEWIDSPQTWNNGGPIVDNDPPLFTISRSASVVVSSGTNFNVVLALVEWWAPWTGLPNPGNAAMQKIPYTWVGKHLTSLSDTSGYITEKGGMKASGLTTVTSSVGTFGPQTVTGTGGAGIWENGAFNFFFDFVGDLSYSVTGSTPTLTMLTDCWINDNTSGTVRYAKGSVYNPTHGTWIIYKAL